MATAPLLEREVRPPSPFLALTELPRALVEAGGQWPSMSFRVSGA